MKRCKVCKARFEPTYTTLQVTCSVPCAIEWGKSKEGAAHATKAHRSETRIMRRKANEQDRTWWLDSTQQAFNKWVRQRDAGLPCIACGRMPNVAYAGHYRSVGACPELRYEPDNCHVQCYSCNSANSGNIGSYTDGLLAKVGPDRLAWIKGPHEPAKWTIDELRAIRDKYKALCKAAESLQRASA